MAKVCKDISALTGNAADACNLFLKRCREQGLNVLITETYRSQERQNELYAQGRTKPGKVVTWTKNSRHTSRRAWDVCKNVKGHEYDDTAFFKACGAIAKELGITWGGDWKTPDMPHFEVAEGWRKPKELEDFEMIAEQKLIALENAVTRLSEKVKNLENPMIYNYIDKNLPDWARATVIKLVEKEFLKGTGFGLGLDESMLRILVILDRAGCFGE